MNTIQCRNQLATQTMFAAHVAQLPVTLLGVKGTSTTFLGGQVVPASEKYPSREQYMRHQEIVAMVESQSGACSDMGDFSELTRA